MAYVSHAEIATTSTPPSTKTCLPENVSTTALDAPRTAERPAQSARNKEQAVAQKLWSMAQETGKWVGILYFKKAIKFEDGSRWIPVERFCDERLDRDPDGAVIARAVYKCIKVESAKIVQKGVMKVYLQ